MRNPLRSVVLPLALTGGTLILLLGLGCEDPAPPPKAAEPAPTMKVVEPPAPTRTVEEPSKPAEAPVAAKAIVCPKPPQVAFSDPALEAEVRRKASKPEGDVTLADLRKVRSVDLTRGKTPVDSLDPCIFPLLTNLHHLYLGAGAYTDLSPIKGLTNLEGLRLSMSQVSDISALSGMLQMDRLDLGRTQVRDLTPLKRMTKMSELMLDDTPVDNLSPLVGLAKLERLSIKRTRVTDVSMLKGLKKLKFLYVGGAPVDNPQAAAHPGLKISGED
jgi:internalin A